MRVWSLISVVALLAACTLAGPGAEDKSVAEANPVTGDAITVTSLDTPVAGATAVETAPGTTDMEAAAIAAAATAAVATKPEAAKAVVAGADATETAATESDAAGSDAAGAAAPVEPEKPAHVATPEETACVRKGGDWMVAGKSGARACVRPTKDGGKRCTKESQCEGACLARSNTCAPMAPLFGCNDVLQDNGVMVTLCID